jgi:hypothetical protein
VVGRLVKTKKKQEAVSQSTERTWQQMNFLSLIENKREGKILAPEQIQEFIREFLPEKFPDKTSCRIPF